MIIGAHIMLNSRDADADRAFLAEILGLSSVDAGGGFLIFGLPPAEIAMHEAEASDAHTLHLMCEDIDEFVAHMSAKGIASTPPANRGWGTMTEITLPGGGTLGVYQPHHARPKAKAVKAKPARKKAAAPKKAAKSKKAEKKAKKKKKAKRR
jgi:catechol 2,3-dioxygenase-like lactoylglutathione lyase family enzyme